MKKEKYKLKRVVENHELKQRIVSEKEARKTGDSFIKRMMEEREFPPEWAGGSGDE